MTWLKKDYKAEATHLQLKLWKLWKEDFHLENMLNKAELIYAYYENGLYDGAVVAALDL